MFLYEKQLNQHRDTLFDLLSTAKEYVPFFKKLKNPCSYYLKNYNNWGDLPFMEKEDIQQKWEDYVVNPSVSEDNSIRLLHTSGSTGRPLKIFRHKREDLLLGKKLWKARREWHPDIMNWRLLYLYRNFESNKLNVLRLGNDEYLDLSEKSITSYLDDIKGFKPQWIIGPPIAVTRLAQILKGKNINSIELVEMFGEKILPYQREIIEKNLGCKVINHYGCRELDVLSYQCSHGSMHAWDEHLFFEVIKDGYPANDGEEGELVVTSLTNKIMPFIRYKVGDKVRLYRDDNQCKCGKMSLLLEPVGGRVSNIVYTRDKVLTSGIFDTVFSRLIRDYEETILNFQVIQKSYDRFIIKLVRGSNFSSFILLELRKELEKFLVDVHYEFIFVDSIKNLDSGKTLTFIPMKKIH
ncbi:phenylacetate--CoA ligase family protein [Priestia filamentosa]|uniref:hypothetical protein n=1 Tax=Priestia filamentosa TaxID=1402861 RepID=UPI001FB539DB|nr:hypothetical protein [Priestia filamentosa]UOE58271.1 phenylacetate--CoA ligase family protein [Priestia filamentosa]